jgi:hypothetical protein
MKDTSLFASIILGAALASGCGVNHESARPETKALDDAHAQEDDHSGHGVEFKVGQGLTIPTITREMLGLKVVDVEEGRATRRVELPLRVFKSESLNGVDYALASGSVATNLSSFLSVGREVSIIGVTNGSPRGAIVRLEPDTAKLTGMAEVVVRLPASGTLQIGAFLDGVVTITTQEDVVVIPKEALLKTAEGHFAYVVNGDSLFRSKISVGGQEGEKVEVTDGLYTGDQVVLQPIMSLWLAELQAIRGGKACADGH